MSAPESTASCSACAGALPDGARFCPACGAPVPGASAPFETGPAPELPGESRRSVPFSRAALLLNGAGAALAAAIVLFVLGHWIGGPILLGVSAAFLALYAAGAAEHERRPRQPGRVSRGRVRVRSLGSGAAAGARARRERVSRRLELRGLAAERDERVRVLGEAVAAGGEDRIAAARAALQSLDERIAALEHGEAEPEPSVRPGPAQQD